LNYQEITDAAIAYSMRTDQETRDMLPVFMQIVESRLNRSLSIGEMFHRATIDVKESQNYYGLPADFLSIRDIQIANGNTLKYVAPEVMNEAIKNSDRVDIYTIIANQIQIYPARPGDVLEVVYRRRIPPLNATDSLNWVSDTTPDLYIFGLLIEISAFAKDGPAGEIWNSRFVSAINSVQSDDDKNRWSSPSLQIILG